MFEVTVTAPTATELRYKLINLVSVMMGEAAMETAAPARVNDVGHHPPREVPEPAPAPSIATPEPVETPPLAPEPEPVKAADPVSDEKLKAEVIRSLQSMFKAGKVDVIRHALTKYGEGAKSFPEIDAAKFPAIKEALAKGEIA